MKVVPAPGRLATSMKPSCSFTTLWTIANPSPVPEFSPVRLFVKKGSKTRSRLAGGIPQPVSATVSTT